MGILDVPGISQAQASATTALLTAKLPAGSRAITYPDHLAKTRAALATVRWTQFNILALGNSIVAGVGSNGDLTSDRTRGFVPQLRQLFAEGLPGEPVGEGLVSNDDPRVTQSGTQAIATYGIRGNRGMLRINSTSGFVLLTLTEPSTDIWVHLYSQWSTNLTTPYYSVDGGAAIAMTGIPTTNDTDWTFKISGLTNAAHTVRITSQEATKVVDVQGWQSRNTNASSGVIVHRAGASGGYINPALTAPSDTNGFPVSHRITLGQTGTNLLILGFGANEASTTGFNSDGWSLSRYETSLRASVTYATSVRGCDVLLLSTGRGDDFYRPTALQQQYADLHEQIASENPRVAHLDIARIWGTYTAANTAGLFYDMIHPSILGHSDMAQIVYTALVNL